MPNLQALTRSEEIRVLTAQGYALGRMDAETRCHPGSSDVAQDFGCYVHDVTPGQAIHDAWDRYEAILRAYSDICPDCGQNRYTGPPCVGVNP